MTLYRGIYSSMKEGGQMEEKRSTYKGNTEAHRRGNAKYLRETVEDVRIRVPKGQKAIIQAHAAGRGESMNQFVIRAIEQTIQRDTGKEVIS